MALRVVSDGTVQGTFVVDLAAGREMVGIETVRWWVGKPEGGDTFERARLQVGYHHVPPREARSAADVAAKASDFDHATERCVLSNGDPHETIIFDHGERVRGVHFAEFKIDTQERAETYLRYRIRHKKVDGERPPDEWVVWHDGFFLDVTIGVVDE